MSLTILAAGDQHSPVAGFIACVRFVCCRLLTGG